MDNPKQGEGHDGRAFQESFTARPHDASLRDVMIHCLRIWPIGKITRQDYQRAKKVLTSIGYGERRADNNGEDRSRRWKRIKRSDT
jgi:hypothetical protein